MLPQMTVLSSQIWKILIHIRRPSMASNTSAGLSKCIGVVHGRNCIVARSFTGQQEHKNTCSSRNEYAVRWSYRLCTAFRFFLWFCIYVGQRFCKHPDYTTFLMIMLCDDHLCHGESGGPAPPVQNHEGTSLDGGSLAHGGSQAGWWT